jgi:hypothetical protein
MTRLAPLLCFLAAASAGAEEPGRVVHREPAGPAIAGPWEQHPVLAVPTPLLVVSNRDTTDGGTTAEFFARLTDLGFACVTLNPPRRRLRRTEVVCTRDDEERFSYAGGWPKDGGVFIVDRILVGREGSMELLGGEQVGSHVRRVLGLRMPQPLMTMQDTAVR